LSNKPRLQQWIAGDPDIIDLLKRKFLLQRAAATGRAVNVSMCCSCFGLVFLGSPALAASKQVDRTRLVEEKH